MKRIIQILILIAVIFSNSCSSDNPPLYKDSSQPVQKRVNDLMKRMTFEEKVGQMCQWVGLEHMATTERVLSKEELRNNSARSFYPGITVEDVKQMVIDGKIGSFLHVLTPAEANYLQSIAQKSRLQIPLLIGIDAVHGNAQVCGATVYPTAIGQAATFDTELVEKISVETAVEMRATGSQWNFSPNIEVARDPRWGRVGETFGEDPYLVSAMGKAAITGYQGSLNNRDSNVVACAKHFIGGSQPVNGTNGAPADLSERTLREIFFPPFEAAVKSGALTFMMAHNEVNGIPCHSNEWLMQEVLKKEWQFKGFIVSDWMDIEHLYDLHHTAIDNKEAFCQAVNAGIDMHMHGPQFYEDILNLVKDKKISKNRVEEACRKILEIKFICGLFDNPYINEKHADSVLFNEKHRATALEAARKSVTLLTNNGILPLSGKKYHRIFVTGPNADSHTILGDWTQMQPEKNVVTILEGLKEIAPDINFTYFDVGWKIKEMTQDKVDKAAMMARGADLSIIVVGEHQLRYNWNEKTCGEDCDRSDIGLPGLQQQLVEKIIKQGVPTVVILVNGRQSGIKWIAENADALVEAWEPGSFGGKAVAEILFGLVNPSGKLPVTIPEHVGQIQMVYNYKPSMYFHPYVIGSSSPLFCFGYGLSYSEYQFSDFTTYKDTLTKGEELKVSVSVTNNGQMDGEEVVQLYIRDIYSSVTRPVKELKHFERISLSSGETKQVKISIPYENLGFYDKNMKWIVEPGDFEIFVGSSSRDEDLIKKIVHVQ
ncbi:MAG: glycoside hydrolase family 3 N-terminal domain-containing protein [Bacteroidales bacterium]